LENEAVVNRLLTDSGGAVELLDASAPLPGLKFKPGLSKWTLAGKDNSFFERWEDVPQSLHTLIRPGMFSAEREDFHLERCIRVLPHLQDTGGFFVAVLQKNGPCLWENKKQYQERDGESETSSQAEEEVKVENDGVFNVEFERTFSRTIIYLSAEVISDSSTNGRKRRNDGRGEAKEKKGRFQGYREDPFVYFDAEKEDPIFTEIREYFDLKVN
jgi:tRNA (cytosine34-C5)-methyltransferase